MTRPRQPQDWSTDLSRAKAGEADFAGLLKSDPRIVRLRLHTAAFDKLDYAFEVDGNDAWVDLKEKIRPSSDSLGTRWPGVAKHDLFVLDETVYRRIIWQGGGGFLVVHDYPMQRWVLFGPWELTLGPRVRFVRELQGVSRLGKGKILLNLATGRQVPLKEEVVTNLLELIRSARASRDQIEPVDIPGYPPL